MRRAAAILPFRNVSAWLDEAIASIVREDALDAVVLVDDGSVDASSTIAALHARRDQRIEIVRTEGVGLPRALERGRARARARYLVRMDGDDVSLPGRIAAQCAFLDAHPEVAAVGCAVEVFPDPSEGLERYVAWQNGIRTPMEHRHALFIEAPLCHPSTTLRAEAVEAVGGWRDGPFPEDYDLWLRLDAAGFGLAKLDRLGLRWRHRPGRLTFSDSRYGRASFRALKAEHLARRLAEHNRFVVWGAGPTGKQLARELERFGAQPSAFIDVDPLKIGRERRGRPVCSPALLDAGPRPFVVVAVGTPGAREDIASALRALGLAEGRDFLAAA